VFVLDKSASLAGNSSSGDSRSSSAAASSHHHTSTTAAPAVDLWVRAGLVVKVMNKVLRDGQYYKQKGAIEKVHDGHICEIKMDGSGHRLKIDQAELETVIPNIGKQVIVVAGSRTTYASDIGATGVLLEATSADGATLRLESGKHQGETLRKVDYNHICKVVQP